MEQYMDFEKRVQQVHKPDRVNPEAVRNLSGTKITEEWKIVCKEDADMVVTTVVADLQEYFQVSVNRQRACPQDHFRGGGRKPAGAELPHTGF